MMGRIAIVVGALIAVLMIPFAVVGQTSDPWVGTWKLNLSKSKYDPGPPPKSMTLKIEPMPGGAFKHTFDGVDAKGQTTHSERVGKFDGNEVPVQAVLPATTVVITNVFKRIDDHSFEAVAKRDGKVAGTTRIVISRDGKTLTSTATGKNPEGQTTTTTSVWDKQ
jgi:hypothetical protein